MTDDAFPPPDVHLPCTTVEPEDFFPEKGVFGEHNRRALRLCRNCPVVARCFQFAMERPALQGIWGATTEGTRRRLRYGPGPAWGQRAIASHGYGGYSRGCKCDECRTAKNERQRELRRRAHAAGSDPGT